MNEQKTAILIDSGCDLPERIRKKYDIEIIPRRITRTAWTSIR